MEVLKARMSGGGMEAWELAPRKCFEFIRTGASETPLSM